MSSHQSGAWGAAPIETGKPRLPLYFASNLSMEHGQVSRPAKPGFYLLLQNPLTVYQFREYYIHEFGYT